MKKLYITVGAMGCKRMGPRDVERLAKEWGGGMDEVLADFMDGRILDNFNDSVVNWELFRKLNIRKLLHKYENTLRVFEQTLEVWRDVLEKKCQREKGGQDEEDSKGID